MLRQIPRFMQLTMLVAVVLAVSATVYQSWSAGGGAGGWMQTKTGPLSPADQDFLQKVRLAGLWEGPTGQQASTQASSSAVREAGFKISQEHSELDAEVRRVANDLGVLLPSSPNAQQMEWMATISAQTGSDYDRTFVQIVREAHGAILPAIAEIRATTRNDTVRDFAEFTDAFVVRHHQYLEGTGLVNYSALRQAASPGFLAGATGPTDLVVPILVFVAIMLGTVSMIAALRKRGTGKRPERVTVPQSRTTSAAPVGPSISPITAVAAIEAPQVQMPDQRTNIAETPSYPPVHDIPTYAASETGSYRRVTENRSRTAVVDPPAYRTASDSGGYPRSSDPGGYGNDSGAHPRASGPVEYGRPFDTGSYPRVSDGGGSYRRDPGSYPRSSDPDGYGRQPDPDPYPRVSGSSRYRAVSDTGDYNEVSDSGSHRMPDTGSHRVDSRSRHSFRR